MKNLTFYLILFLPFFSTAQVFPPELEIEGYSLESKGKLLDSMKCISLPPYSSFQFNFFYDSENRPILKDFYQAQSQSPNIWRHKRITDYTYEDDNLVEELEKSKIFTSDPFGNSARTMYEYDSEDRITKRTYQQWSTSREDWYNGTRTEHVYNSEGALQMTTRWKESSSVWGRDRLFSYQYDSEGRTEILTEQKWSQSPFGWADDLKRTYSYDQDDLRTAILLERWIDTLSVWKTLRVDSFFYDTDQNLIEEHSSLWNSNIDDFTYFTRTIWEFDGEGNKTLIQNYTWNAPFNNWLNSRRWTQEFDDNNLMIMRKEEVWDRTFGIWEEIYTCQYYWRDFSSDTKKYELEKPTCKIPNPLSSGMQIDCADLPVGSYQMELRNAIGQLLSTRKISGGEKAVFEKTVPSGLYYFSISDGNSIGETRQIFIN